MLWLFLVVFIFSGEISTHRSGQACIIPNGASISHTRYEAPPISKRDAQQTGLRIHVHYSQVLKSRPDFEDVKNLIVEPAVKLWSSALRPKKPTASKLRLSRDCEGAPIYVKKGQYSSEKRCKSKCAAETKCFGRIIPDNYLDDCRDESGKRIGRKSNGGVKGADYILFVDASRDSQCDYYQLNAYAFICQMDGATDRPVAGVIQLCPDALMTEYPVYRVSFGNALHEIGHALGFTTQAYAFLRNPDGSPRTPRNAKTNLPDLGMDAQQSYVASENTLMNITRTWRSVNGVTKQTFPSLQLPTVLDFGRKHFDCPTLDGFDLENDPSPGSYAAHLEQRVAESDVMTAAHARYPKITNLTLGYFEDSGWYHVNYSMAEPFTWGKNLGCNFVTKSCYAYMLIQKKKKQSFFPYCTATLERHCLPGENVYGECNLIRHGEPLPEEYQYFKSLPGVPADEVAYYGGGNGFAEYCPYYQPRVLVGGHSFSSYCEDEENSRILAKEFNYFYEGFGKNSICVQHYDNWTYTYGSYSINPVAYGASCHQYKCVKSQGLVLVMGEKEFRCPPNGGRLFMEVPKGTTMVRAYGICPPCSEHCQVCPSNRG